MWYDILKRLMWIYDIWGMISMIWSSAIWSTGVATSSQARHVIDSTVVLTWPGEGHRPLCGSQRFQGSGFGPRWVEARIGNEWFQWFLLTARFYERCGVNIICYQNEEMECIEAVVHQRKFTNEKVQRHGLCKCQVQDSTVSNFKMLHVQIETEDRLTRQLWRLPWWSGSSPK